MKLTDPKELRKMIEMNEAEGGVYLETILAKQILHLRSALEQISGDCEDPRRAERLRLPRCGRCSSCIAHAALNPE